MVARARSIASERKVSNVTFSVANTYNLPFPDRTFDAVFAHAVLMFVRDPVAALTEIRRVLRAGGFVGLRDPDLGSRILEPATPLLQEWLELRVRVRKHDGGDSSRARHHRELLLDSGFARADAAAGVTSAGSLAETRRSAAFEKAQFDGLVRTALTEGWLDDARAEAMGKEILDWGERPNAFSATVWCETLGWV